METTAVELAADSIAVSLWAAGRAQLVPGPPFPVFFVVQRGDQWPAVRLLLSVREYGVVSFETTEPRLKAALKEILEELA
jgi:hypothetical protein